MASDSGIGQRIRAARKEKGWTLRELSRQSGIAPGNLSQLETGKKAHPRVETLRRIASTLGVPLAELVDSRPLPPDAAKVVADALAAVKECRERLVAMEAKLIALVRKHKE